MNEIVTKETLDKEASALTRAREWVVNSDEDYAALDAFSMDLKGLETFIKADFKESKEKAFAAHKAISSQEKAHLNKVTEARALCRPKLVAWENKRKAEQDELDRIARAKARKEAEDKALADAELAASEGHEDAADAILEAPVVLAPTPPPPPPLKRKTVISEAWTCEVTNEAAVPAEWKSPDMPRLMGYARSSKKAARIPGVRFWDKNA